jgi:hypothetical protein
MPIILAIPGKPPLEVDAELISIGSDPAGAVVLSGDDRIKPRHAVIRRVAGRWLVEAREADSIQVGNAPPGRVHWLSPGDVIRLTERGTEITFQPPPASPARAAASARPQVETGAPAAAVRAMPAEPLPQVVPPLRATAAPPPAPDPFAMEPVELVSLKAAVASEERLRVKPLPTAGEGKSAPPPQPPQKKLSPALGFAAGVAVVGVVAAAVWIVQSGRGGGEDGKPRQARPRGENDERPVVKKKKKKREDQETASIAAADPDETATSPKEKVGVPEPAPQRPPRKTQPVTAEPAALTDPQRFLYAVLVRDAAGEQQFRLGTAWAVSPRRVVTSGAVAMAIEELQKSGLTAVVAPAGKAAAIKVTGMRVHPAYRQGFQDAAAARAQLEPAKAAAASAKKRKPTGDFSANDGPSAKARLDRGYASQAEYDVGILDVEQTLTHLLMPSFTGPVVAEEQLRLVGLPFPADAYRVTETVPTDRVEKFAFAIAGGEDGKVDPLHLTLDFSGELAGRNWSGSPILNAAGHVVGVYSRPLATPDDGKSPAEVRLSHAVTPIARLRDIAPDLQ